MLGFRGYVNGREMLLLTKSKSIEEEQDVQTFCLGGGVLKQQGWDLHTETCRKRFEVHDHSSCSGFQPLLQNLHPCAKSIIVNRSFRVMAIGIQELRDLTKHKMMMPRETLCLWSM